MGFSNYHMFKGRLSEVSIQDIVSQLDYTLSSYEERLDLVKSLLGEDFFTEYFTSHFKVNINTTDAGATDNNICKSIEKITDYLLSSEEVVREYKEKKTMYKFFPTEERLKEALNKELYIENVVAPTREHNEDDLEEDDIIFMLSKKTNSLKEKKISVLKSDLDREDYTGEVLREYNTLKEYLNFLKNDTEARKEKGVSRGKLSFMIKTVNADMLLAKRLLNHRTPLMIKNPGDEGQVIDWTCLDYTNVNHIRALLYSNSTVITNDNELSYLVYDLETMIRKLVEKKRLRERDLIIIKMIRQGYNQEEIAVALKISQERVSQKIVHISQVISSAFRKEEELFEHRKKWTSMK